MPKYQNASDILSRGRARRNSANTLTAARRARELTVEAQREVARETFIARPDIHRMSKLVYALWLSLWVTDGGKISTYVDHDFDELDHLPNWAADSLDVPVPDVPGLGTVMFVRAENGSGSDFIERFAVSRVNVLTLSHVVEEVPNPMHYEERFRFYADSNRTWAISYPDIEQIIAEYDLERLTKIVREELGLDDE